MPSLSPLSSLAPHVDVLGGSSRVPAPPTSAETKSPFRSLAVFFCFKETNQHWLIVTREANHMLWRKGNRHVWFTSGVNFAITKITKPKYPSVLVRIWFHFWFSAIDAKGLIKTAIDERSFHLRGARPAHVFHRWVQTVPIRYLRAMEKDTNNR